MGPLRFDTRRNGAGAVVFSNAAFARQRLRHPVHLSARDAAGTREHQSE
jgi:hypothetical protein